MLTDSQPGAGSGSGLQRALERPARVQTPDAGKSVCDTWLCLAGSPFKLVNLT